MDTIENSIRKTIIFLEDVGYSRGTITRYRRCWNRLVKYATQRNIQEFTLDFGYDFLIDYYEIDFDVTLKPHQTFAVRAIKVLNDFSKGVPFTKCYQPKKLQIPDCYLEILMNYTKSLGQLCLADQTIKGKQGRLIHFFHFLEANGMTEISKIQSHHVLIYIDSLTNYANSTKETILYTLRDFFKFLTTHKYNAYHLARLFPVIRSNKLEKLPSYYTTDEIRMILSSVDRSTAIGRRDYLILLLAIQLGMRAGDIRKLKIDDIKWHIEKIEFIQEKTKNSLQLPLSDNVKYALIDYLKNGRPHYDDPHIFIRHRTPYRRFEKGHVFWSVINKYLVLAQIEPKNRKHGLHTMRHSLASNLLRDNIPMPVISGILGHESSNTTKNYLRIDIEQLRAVCLEVPL